MTVTPTKLDGCFIIEPRLFEDDRGYFFESYNQADFGEVLTQEVRFVQDNQAFSHKGVIRGLHYQLGDHAQAKLVRVLQGTVLDIAVDIRKDSSTFKEYIALELSASNKKQLFIPRGFAHGYIVLSETAEFFYKCDNYYNPDAEGGIRYDDPDLDIDWNMPKEDHILSAKDAALPFLIDAQL